MKKIYFPILLVAVVFFMSAPFAFAISPGTSPASLWQISQDQKVIVIKITCVGDESDGSVPNTSIASSSIPGLPSDYYRMGFYIYDAWVVVGGTAPDAADVAITDDLGRTVYSEVGLIPTSGTNEGTVTVKNVISPLTVTQSNQATVDATWDLYILLAR